MIIIEEFEVKNRKFDLKKALAFDIRPTVKINDEYGVQLKFETQPLCVVLDFGGTGSYKNIFVTGSNRSELVQSLHEILATLYDEAHDPENDSPQDKWFRENMTELKGE